MPNELTCSEIADTETSVKFYKKILDLGKTKKKCLGCDRAIHDNEKPHFEAYVSRQLFAQLTTDRVSHRALLDGKYGRSQGRAGAVAVRVDESA